MMALLQKPAKLRKQPFFIQVWLLPIWLLLGISRAAILFVPFRYLVRLSKKQGQPNVYIPVLSADQDSRVRQISLVIKIASRLTPWTSNCFPRALTALVLLRLYDIPHSLFFGVLRTATDEGLAAHAWIAAGPVQVTGGDGFKRFAVVGFLASPSI